MSEVELATLLKAIAASGDEPDEGATPPALHRPLRQVNPHAQDDAVEGMLFVPVRPSFRGAA